MKFPELLSYIWLQQAFLALYMIWFFDNEIFAQIQSGGLAYELCRPLDIYSMWYVKNMAGRLCKVVLRCLPILIIAFIMPNPYKMQFVNDFNTFVLFVVSMIMAFLVVLSFLMIIYAITIYTVSSLGIRLLAASVSEFFSGSIIPLPFLPDNILKVVNVLPWASMQNTPFRIYSGNISGMDAIYAIMLQVFWFLVLTCIGKLMLNNGLKNVVVQGG